MLLSKPIQLGYTKMRDFFFRT